MTNIPLIIIINTSKTPVCQLPLIVGQIEQRKPDDPASLSRGSQTYKKYPKYTAVKKKKQLRL